MSDGKKDAGGNMPASNSVMIHKLQNAMNEKFDARILYNKRQWYSDDQNRPVTTYVISKAVWDDNKSRYNNIELFKSCSQIQIVLYLRDYWYELNGWEVPHDNPMWEKAKEKYQEKQQPNDINPVCGEDITDKLKSSKRRKKHHG